MSGAEYQIADQIVDIGDLLKWVGHARVEIARLRAQLRTAETRTQAALDDRADAETRGYRKGAAACLADVAQLETEAAAVVDAAAPCSDYMRGHRYGAYRMARRIRQRHEVEAAGRYRPPTEAQIARDEADKAEAEGADR
jgi:hypothetical protein